MINGPPSSEASGSTTNETTNRTDFKTTGQLSVPSLNGSQSIPHANYAAWSSNFSGYATTTANPAMFGSYYASTTPYPTGYAPPSSLPYQSKSYNPYSHLFYKRNDNVKENPPISLTNQTGSATPSQVPGPPERAVTPPLPKPETFRHWDEVLKRFLEKIKMTEAVKGFENDTLVLNSEWEQKVVPDALKELASGLQVIMDRISGKSSVDDTTIEAVCSDGVLGDERSLEDRKLDYVQLKNGQEPQPQSSINKSISQFLARTRARNDASNRAEFLHTLSEKKQKLINEARSQDNSEPASGGSSTNDLVKDVTSCARVNGKPIDREKQIKYDIAKNEDGPLTRTAVKKPLLTDSSAASTTIVVPENVSSTSRVETPALEQRPRKKRRFGDVEEESAKSTANARTLSKGKRKAKEQQPTSVPISSPSDQAGNEALSTKFMADMDERMLNIEEHLAVRYVPSLPRTLLARLKYLEDHIIRLEKEYPPWAALHFNQPNRGWPPPPRKTPIIVPPHLRSTTSTAHPPPPMGTGPGPHLETASSAQAIPQASVNAPGAPKGKNKQSSLQKAVMDRLEVEQAMHEMRKK